jgi:hypothetical protein
VTDADDSDARVERPFAAGTASFYARYRREYPDELVARLLQLAGASRGAQRAGPSWTNGRVDT